MIVYFLICVFVVVLRISQDKYFLFFIVGWLGAVCVAMAGETHCTTRVRLSTSGAFLCIIVSKQSIFACR